MKKKFQIGQIVENRIPNGSIIICRVVGYLTSGDYRLTDARETASFDKLIETDKTWVAPEENVYWHDSECSVCHKDGLIYLG